MNEEELLQAISTCLEAIQVCNQTIQDNQEEINQKYTQSSQLFCAQPDCVNQDLQIMWAEDEKKEHYETYANLAKDYADRFGELPDNYKLDVPEESGTNAFSP